LNKVYSEYYVVSHFINFENTLLRFQYDDSINNGNIVSKESRCEQSDTTAVF